MTETSSWAPTRLEIVRRQTNITQEQLANAAGCTQATISNIERRITKTPDAESLQQIVTALRKLGADMSLIPAGASLLEPWTG